mmetsp:Transcript_49116/g.129625  ORF Transcript_49116/g.129625 Transcript_49116/m.129625 type:complete len:88 (-) Transcript_49116:347-610(-)
MVFPPGGQGHAASGDQTAIGVGHDVKKLVDGVIAAVLDECLGPSTDVTCPGVEKKLNACKFANDGHRFPIVWVYVLEFAEISALCVV